MKKTRRHLLPGAFSLLIANLSGLGFFLALASSVWALPSTQVPVQGAFSPLTVRNYTAAPASIVQQITRTAENSIISHPTQPLEHFGSNDLLILTKRYVAWIKDTVTPVRQANNTGSGGGMLKGWWTINGDNTNPNFKFGDRALGVLNELGRSGWRESDGCVLAVQIGSGADTGNAYFANFSENTLRSGPGFFPQPDVPTGIGVADIYYYSGTIRNALLDRDTLNGNKINYIMSYHVNNESSMIEINPVLEATGPISEVAVAWNSCEVNDYATPLRYLKFKANAHYRFTWGTPDERAVYLDQGSVSQTAYIKQPSDVWGQPSIPGDGAFRDMYAFSTRYKTESGRTTSPPNYYRPLELGKTFFNAGLFAWGVDDLLGSSNHMSLMIGNSANFNNRTLIFRVLRDTNGFDREGLNNVQMLTSTFTDYFSPQNVTVSRPPAPNTYNSLEQDPSVVSLEAYLFHKNAYVRDVVNGIVSPYVDVDGNQITAHGNKNFSTGRIWNFVYQFGHVILPVPPTPRPGDLNSDGSVNLADIQYYLQTGNTNVYTYNAIVANFNQ